MRLVYSPLLAEWCVRNLQKHKSQTDLTLLNKPRISWNHTPPVPLSTMPPVLNTIVSTLLVRITPCSPNHSFCFGAQKRPHHLLFISCILSAYLVRLVLEMLPWHMSRAITSISWLRSTYIFPDKIQWKTAVLKPYSCEKTIYFYKINHRSAGNQLTLDHIYF